MEKRVSHYHTPHQKWAGQVGTTSSKKVLNYFINKWYAYRRLKAMISSSPHFYDNLSLTVHSFSIGCMTVGYSLFYYLLVILGSSGMEALYTQASLLPESEKNMPCIQPPVKRQWRYLATNCLGSAQPDSTPRPQRVNIIEVPCK